MIYRKIVTKTAAEYSCFFVRSDCEDSDNSHLSVKEF